VHERQIFTPSAKATVQSSTKAKGLMLASCCTSPSAKGALFLTQRRLGSQAGRSIFTLPSCVGSRITQHQEHRGAGWTRQGGVAGQRGMCHLLGAVRTPLARPPTVLTQGNKRHCVAWQAPTSVWVVSSWPCRAGLFRHAGLCSSHRSALLKLACRS
jgi:hypothetical protein